MRGFSIYDMYRRNAHLYKNRTAVAAGGLRLSFEALLRDSNAFAAALAAKEIGKGDRIAVLAMNDPRFFTVFGAVSAIGAIVVPLNRRLADEEIAFILTDSGSRILISDGNYAKKARTLADTIGGIQTIFWDPAGALSLLTLHPYEIVESNQKGLFHEAFYLSINVYL